ncbi:DWNN domain-containing protein, partial [Dimargaris cristalligena]
MSLIHYKFKASKNYSSVVFDGLSISLYDLKQEVLKANKLDPESFDVIISNAQTGEDYTEDNSLISRNTSVFVRRIPVKPGRSGLSSGYGGGLSGGGGRNYPPVSGAPSGYPSNPTPTGGATSSNWNVGSSMSQFGSSSMPLTEEEGIQRMFQQSSQQWEQRAEELATSHAKLNRYRPQPRNPLGPGGGQQANRPLPPNYVCHRCGQKGHWIFNCPTNAEKNFGQPRIKRTTGIPKSFLQKIDALPEDKGAMVTEDGSLVVAQANDAAWQKFHKSSQQTVATDAGLEGITVPADFKCALCQGLIKEAVRTPCCQTAYCDDCITGALLDTHPSSHFTCPHCRKSALVPDQLIPDPALRQRIDHHIQQWVTNQSQTPTTSD